MALRVETLSASTTSVEAVASSDEDRWNALEEQGFDRPAPRQVSLILSYDEAIVVEGTLPEVQSFASRLIEAIENIS